MINELLANTIITSSITGAGLVFVAYNLLIPFYKQLKEFRDEKIEEARKSIKEGIKNKESSEKLRFSFEQLQKFEDKPFYLSMAGYGIFVLYLLSVFSGVLYLTSLDSLKSMGIENSPLWLFSAATLLFGLVGISLLSDILEFMRNYLEIKKQTKK